MNITLMILLLIQRLSEYRECSFHLVAYLGRNINFLIKFKFIKFKMKSFITIFPLLICLAECFNYVSVPSDLIKNIEVEGVKTFPELENVNKILLINYKFIFLD
jgi:hypothetical protein